MALKQGEGMKTLWLSVCLMGAMSTGLMADGDADADVFVGQAGA